MTEIPSFLHPRWIRETAFAVVAAMLAFLLYTNTLQHDYSYDDYYINSGNPHIREGLKGIGDILTSRYYDENGVAFGYRPATQITFAIESEFWGDNPHHSHLINALLYAILVMYMYYLLRILRKDITPVFALIVVMIFAFHPIHTEAVANIKNRDTLLSMLFSLLATEQFYRFFRGRRFWHLVPGFLFFIIAIFAKEEALVYSAIIPLTAWFFTTLKVVPVRISLPSLHFHPGRIPSFRISNIKNFLNPYLYILLAILAASGWAVYTKNLPLYGILRSVGLIYLIVYFLLRKPYGKIRWYAPFLHPVVLIGLLLTVIPYTHLLSWSFWTTQLDLLLFSWYVFRLPLPSLSQWLILRLPRVSLLRKTEKGTAGQAEEKEGWRFMGFILITIILISTGLASYLLPNIYLPVESIAFTRAENPLLIHDPAFDKFTLGLSSLWFYVKKLFWPHPLGFYYGYNMIPAAKWSSPIVLGSLAFHSFLLILAIWLIRKKSILSYGILFYLAALSLFSNFILPVPGIVGERFLFSASLGFSIILSWLLFQALRIPLQEKPVRWFQWIGLAAIILAMLIPAAWKVHSRNKDWKDYETLFLKDADYLKNSVKAQYTLAEWWSQQLFNDYQAGTRGPDLIVRAERTAEHLYRILDVDSTYKYAWNNLGVLYSDLLNQNSRSIASFQQAIRFDSTYADAHYNLGTGYLREGILEGALFHYQRAIRLNPAYIRNVTDMADSYFFNNRLREPMHIYPMLLEIDSTLVVPTRNYGFCHLLNNDTTTAIQYLTRAFELDPTNTALGNDLYNYFLSKGQYSLAEYYQLKTSLYRKQQ